jgi:hypothetical protein
MTPPDDWKDHERGFQEFDRTKPTPPPIPIGAVGEDMFVSDERPRPRVEVAESSRGFIPQNSIGFFDFTPDEEFRRKSTPPPSSDDAESMTQQFDSNGQPVQGGADQTSQLLQDLVDLVRDLPAEIVEQLRSS